MQTCSNCQSNQLDGAIFCLECGASLFQKSRRETTMSLGHAHGTGEFVAPPPVVIPAPAAESGPTLTLLIMNSGRRLSLDITGDILIGRKDNARGIFPDVDLGLDGGYDAGVSRQHALLSCHEGMYMVKDLGSANGTFVNSQRLPPQTPVPLHNGDELKCGTLLIRVEFA